MKINQFIDKAADLASENLEYADYLEFERLEEQIKEEYNSLILALAKTDPYHKYPVGVSYICIHCGTKYKALADPLDPKEHHSESCLWLQAYKLAELCQK